MNADFAARLPADVADKMYACVIDLWGHVVQGCPITLTYNIRPERGLSNGTRATVHSVVLSEHEPETTAQLLERSNPAQVITLQHPPLTVNVAVPAEPSDDVALRLTATGDRIIPLFAISRDVNFARYIKIQSKKKGVVSVSAHPFSLLFATTFHGVQCRTLDKIILCVDHPVTPTLSYNAFYVGLSRVRRTTDLRLLQLRSADDAESVMRRLRSLMPRAQLVNYMSAHKSMPATFKHLRDIYLSVGIGYDQKGANKVLKKDASLAPSYPCRKYCGILFVNQSTRASHERECNAHNAAIETFQCRKGCGRTWVRDSYRRLHEPHCTHTTSSTSLSTTVTPAAAQPSALPASSQPGVLDDPSVTSIVVDSMLQHLHPTNNDAFTNAVLDSARAALPPAQARIIERLGKRKERQ